MWNISGKTALITGANTGIGRATATGLAKAGAKVVLAGRSREKTQPIIDAIAAQTGNGQLSFLPLDLGDLASVKAAADSFLARGEPLHVLVHNAGVSGLKQVTKQGFEYTFGVNHLGHFLLFKLLEPALVKGAPARLVVLGSRAHENARGIDWEHLKQPARGTAAWPEYMQSKLANTLFAVEAARRLAPDTIRVYVVHPGVIASELWRNLPWPFSKLVPVFLKTPEQGARSSLFCATSDAVSAHHGRYYDEDGSERQTSDLAQDAALAKRLWEESEAWVKEYLPR